MPDLGRGLVLHHARRPPAPVITSNRRTLPGSGLLAEGTSFNAAAGYA